MKKTKLNKMIWYGITLMLFSFQIISCDENLADDSFNIENVLDLSVGNQDIILDQKLQDESLILNWNSGSNQKTNAAISYVLQIDKGESDFSSPLEYDLGKNIFSFKLESKVFNNILLNTYNILPGEAELFEARIIANFANDIIEPQTAAVSFSATPYKPVSNELFIVGNASPNGWDISNATALKPINGKDGLFEYQGKLSAGNFKFSVNQDDCWCQDFYNKNIDDEGILVYNEGGTGEDLQWEIIENGQYVLTVDILNLTINIKKIEGPVFSKLWIVGDASPSGWNIDTPQEFEIDPNDSFVFTYEAQLNPGSFKILAGELGNWCGEWYRPFTEGQDLSSTNVEQNSGCDVDNKWVITDETKGRYKITVNTLETTINIEKVNLYIIGDGGSNGWDINSPTPMEYSNGKYIFNGSLGENNSTGEFKISKFKGDWCDGDWLNAVSASQSITNTSFITTRGCDGPDNKWKLTDGDAGVYNITIDLDLEEMSITKQ